MNTNQQPNDNQNKTTIDTTLALFANLNDTAQLAAMSVIRLADAIREGVVTGDMREMTLEFLASAFDAGSGAGQGTKLT